MDASKASAPRLIRLSTHDDARGLLRRVVIRALIRTCALPGALALASCSTSIAPPSGSPVAVAKAAASGNEPDAEPPRESAARTVDGYKRDAARRVYFKNTTLLYDGAPPPMLKSVVILSIRIDAQGKPLRVALVRGNGYRDLEQRAIESVRAAAPLPVPHASLLTKGALEYFETWLFRDDDRFQIRSLADVQQGAAQMND